MNTHTYTHTYTHSQALNRREPPLSRAGAAANLQCPWGAGTEAGAWGGEGRSWPCDRGPR